MVLSYWEKGMKFTKDMDAHKADLCVSTQFQACCGDVQKVFGDHSIDNIMAGVLCRKWKSSLNKKNNKGALIGNQQSFSESIQHDFDLFG